MEIYKTSKLLESDEYLLKISGDKPLSHSNPPSGFFAKPNQKTREIPVSMDNWGNYSGHNGYASGEKARVYIFKETFRSGWRMDRYRYGTSQNWVTVIHPEGFKLEIYLSNLLEIAKNSVIDNGELIGEYKWEKKSLVPK